MQHCFHWPRQSNTFTGHRSHLFYSLTLTLTRTADCGLRTAGQIRHSGAEQRSKKMNRVVRISGTMHQLTISPKQGHDRFARSPSVREALPQRARTLLARLDSSRQEPRRGPRPCRARICAPAPPPTPAPARAKFVPSPQAPMSAGTYEDPASVEDPRGARSGRALFLD